MNSKKAKMLRKSGKVEKKVKKMYNSLSHNEKFVLSQAYSDVVRTILNEFPKADQRDI